MPEKVEMEVEISPVGAVKIHIKGIKGKGCLDIMKRLEKELGYVKEKRYTSEYYEEEEKSRIHRRL